VLDHGDEYDWSIVGEPSGRYLWLLARDPRPDPALIQSLLTRVEELGYDRWALRITQQALASPNKL
jgi:apolipoprotein D and lipocalin family protein